VIRSSPERVSVWDLLCERRGRLPTLIEKRSARDSDPGACRIMPGNDGPGEHRVARRGGMMRRQRLCSGREDDEQRNERPGRDDHTPSRGSPIGALRCGFGFETFQHAITRFVALKQIGWARI